MLGAGLPAERLREYLQELKPQARSLLIAELERALLRGDETPGAELVLNELRRSLRESGHRMSRLGTPARLFFQPLEPFLVDDEAEHQHQARVARAAIEPIWQWMRNIGLPSETASYVDQVERALALNDAAGAAKLARMFQNAATQRMQDAIDGVSNDDRAVRRFIIQVGTPLALDDLRIIVDVFKGRDSLTALGSQMPRIIKTLSGPVLENVRMLLDLPNAQRPNIFPYALITVMNRLAAPWQLIRLATSAAESDNVTRISETPYPLAVSIVLMEIDRLVNELSADLKSGRGIAVSALLKDVHDAVRGVRTEIDLSVDSPWSRQHAEILTKISAALTAVIELTPGRVRRLLRPNKEPMGTRLDADDVNETELLVGFVATCRNYASELAVNEITMRAYSELKQYLDTGTHTLLEVLRTASPSERLFRQSQVDAAVRFCAKLFGQEYASLLAKAAEVAAQDLDRKKA